VDAALIFDVIMKVVGGLGIFLLGMKNMSEGMQAVAGDRLRRLIGSVTNNRFAACAVGTLVTCMVQSSSVTTVMVVGLVNSSFMTLTQAIGVIMGANIGTTITGWILVLKIGKYGLPMLGVAALIYLFSRKDSLRYTAMTVMGVGMVFFGLELMSGGFKPLRHLPEFVGWFSRFSAESYLGVLKCAAVGCLLTMTVQSSSATLGITIGLAEAGIIPFHTAAALVLGENIGTTITALLASLGANANARRAAVSHTIFNVTGVLWITAMFPLYMRLLDVVVGGDPGMVLAVDGVDTFPHMRQGIALAHSGFNVVNTLLFLPLLPVLAAIVTRLVPEKKEKEVPHLTFLTVRMLDTPAIGIEQSLKEILRMANGVSKMMDWLKAAITGKERNPERDRKLFHREEVLDTVQREVMEFLSNMLSGSVPHDIMRQTRAQLRIADEYESISDYIVTIAKLDMKLERHDLEISPEGMAEIMDLHERVAEYVKIVTTAVEKNDRDVLTHARSETEAITRLMKNARRKHLDRMQQGAVTPNKSLIYSDMLTAYRKIGDHALNIAEALAA